MDKNKYAIIWEMARDVFGISIIYYYGGWFGSLHFAAIINYILIFYFILSSATAAWFAYRHRTIHEEGYAF